MKAQNGTFIADTREKDDWESDPAALAAAACVRGVVASIEVPREAEEASHRALRAVMLEMERRPASRPWWKRWLGRRK